MDVGKLRIQIAQMRRSLLEEGVLNNQFREVEMIEDHEPHFIENLIFQYITQSTLFLDELEETLKSKPLDLVNTERLIMKLKGGSASIGAGKFNAVVNEILAVFRSQQTERLDATYIKVRAGHALMRRQLGPYAELLRQLRMQVTPDETSDNRDDDVESTDSNEVDDE